MKSSILVIAHNEEKYIGLCLDSICAQSTKPDEIVVVAHNCNDSTEAIIQRYSNVRLVSLKGNDGVTYARIKGFQEVNGDIVACIDGDAHAEYQWFEKIISPLSDPSISGVGTVVMYTGSIISRLASYKYFYFKFFLNWLLKKYNKFYFFGPSFAVRKKDYEDIGGFEPFPELRKKIGLINWPDDAYLGISLWNKGRVVLVKDKHTKVFARAKNLGLYGIFVRPFEQILDGKKIFDYLRIKKVLP